MPNVVQQGRELASVPCLRLFDAPLHNTFAMPPRYLAIAVDEQCPRVELFSLGIALDEQPKLSSVFSLVRAQRLSQDFLGKLGQATWLDPSVLEDKKVGDIPIILPSFR